MALVMEKVSKQLVTLCLNEFQKDHNKAFLQDEILDPLIMHILDKLQPIIIITSAYFITTIVLFVILIAVILTPKF